MIFQKWMPAHPSGSSLAQQRARAFPFFGNTFPGSHADRPPAPDPRFVVVLHAQVRPSSRTTLPLAAERLRLGKREGPAPPAARCEGASFFCSLAQRGLTIMELALAKSTAQRPSGRDPRPRAAHQPPPGAPARFRWPARPRLAPIAPCVFPSEPSRARAVAALRPRSRPDVAVQPRSPPIAAYAAPPSATASASEATARAGPEEWSASPSARERRFDFR